MSILSTSLQAGTFHTYSSGDETVVENAAGTGSEPAVFQLTSTSTTYAGMGWLPTSTTTVNQITQLSADYLMTEGSFFGGAPRFSISDNSNNEAYIYWGTPSGGGTFSNANSAWANTGDSADLTSADVRVYSNGFGGLDSPNTGMTWANFIAQVGGIQISEISLDLDAGWGPGGTQQMFVDNFTVNSDVFDAQATQATPEPGTASMLGIAAAAVLFAARRARSVRN